METTLQNGTNIFKGRKLQKKVGRNLFYANTNYTCVAYFSVLFNYMLPEKMCLNLKVSTKSIHPLIDV